MNKLSLTTLFLIACLSAYSANNDKSATILKETQAKLQSHKSLQVSFIYKLTNKSKNINESIKGTLTTKGQMYKLDFSEQIIFCNSKKVWTLLKDANEVQLNNFDKNAENETVNPFKMLENYDKSFNSKLVKETAQSFLIQLLPTNKKNLKTINILINKLSKQIVKINIIDKNGNEYEYSVINYVADKNFSNSFFEFNSSDYPNVEIVDMR